MSTGQQLVSEGRPITLASGEVVHLRITNRAMVKIEELFGSYAAFQLGMRAGAETPIWTSITKGVWCALQYDPEWRNDWAKVLDALDPARFLGEYQDALLDAILEAFPPTPAQPEEPPKAEPTTNGFGGPNSTPQADGISDLATTSFGT